MNTQPLLTITIPTYNRASYLQLCIEQFCTQIIKNNALIELIISNNCSTDNTEIIVQGFCNKYSFIQYHKQAENIGADGNFAWCFNKAKGKYVWIFGDDDVLLNNKLEKIIDILLNNTPDILYVKGYGYSKDDYIAEAPKKIPIMHKPKIQHFKTSLQYIKQVHYNVTFASGSIVNKSIIPLEYSELKFIGTNLVQTSWIFEALMSGTNFSIFNENVMAIKTNNTGGYKLFQTFGNNFNDIINHYTTQLKMPRRFKSIINFNLLLSFFPQYVLLFKKENINKFDQENPKKILHSLFKSNIWYYVFVYPLFILPINLSNFYIKKILNNINRLLNAFH